MESKGSMLNLPSQCANFIAFIFLASRFHVLVGIDRHASHGVQVLLPIAGRPCLRLHLCSFLVDWLLLRAAMHASPGTPPYFMLLLPQLLSEFGGVEEAVQAELSKPLGAFLAHTPQFSQK
eukprot:876200-Pelagomonas_calceolata.AAC.4